MLINKKTLNVIGAASTDSTAEVDKLIAIASADGWDIATLIDQRQSGKIDLAIVIFAWLALSGAAWLVYLIWSYAETTLEMALKL